MICPSQSRARRGPRRRRAFTLVEALVGMVLVGVTFTALYAGVTFGINSLRRSREDVRATQIMVEKLDTIRLYGWDKIKTPGYLPASFVDEFVRPDPGTRARGTAPTGSKYYGSITVQSNLPVHSSYQSNLVQVTVRVRWTNSAPREASLSTFVARHGLQTYVY